MWFVARLLAPLALGLFWWLLVDLGYSYRDAEMLLGLVLFVHAALLDAVYCLRRFRARRRRRKP